MPTILKVWSDDFWQGVPETFPGDPQGQSYINNNTKMAFVFFGVDICTDGTETIMSNTAGSLE